MSDEFKGIDSQGLAQEESSQDVRTVLIPSLILIGSQIPLTAVYLFNLVGSREHYMLFPVALVAVIYLLMRRWPKGEKQPFFPSILSMVLLGFGLVLAIFGTIFLSPWFGFASLVAFAGSLLARTNERRRFGSLIALMFPLLVLVQPPAGIDFDSVQGDIDLMSAINSGSAWIASDILDVLGSPVLKMNYVHLVAGSRIINPGGSVDTIDIGTGSGSVFTLLIATAIFIAFKRRPLVRAMALLAVCVFWATVGEAIHAVICVAGARSFEWNWLENAEPMWLRLATLVFSFVMIWLSDHLLAFMFGKVDMTTIDPNLKGQYWMCQSWNFVIAGIESPVIDVNVPWEIRWANWRKSAPSNRIVRILWTAAIGCSVLALIQIIGIVSASSKAASHALQQGNGDWVELSGNLLPASLAGAELRGHHKAEPLRKTAYRVFENTWTFSDNSRPEIHYEIAVSQAWPGWHDAIASHKRYEWILNDLQPASGTIVEPELLPGVPMLFAEYHNTIAENGLLVFCQFDAFGEPFERPLTWSNIPDFFRRAIQRTGNRTRPRMMVPYSILIEIKVDAIGDLPESVRSRALELFAAATGIVRQKIIDQQLQASGTSTADTHTNETDRSRQTAE